MRTHVRTASHQVSLSVVTAVVCDQIDGCSQ